MGFDTKEEVVKKFNVLLSKLFDTLAFVASKMIKKGFDAPHPRLISMSKDFMLNEVDSGKLLLSFAKSLHLSWNKIFLRDYQWVEDNLVTYLGNGTPSYCVETAKGILSAKNVDGKLAIEEKDKNFLFKILEGFVILSIKYVFWEMEPVTVMRSGTSNFYTFKNQIPGLETLDINDEIKVRLVTGLPDYL